MFEDDAPSISTNSTTEPTLTVDETVLATNASASFAGLFSGAYGADGAGTTTYGLAITAGPSGLVDIATLEAVNLVMNGGVVEGRTAVTNQLVFTASVDANGVVTLDQIRAVQHTPDLGPDQPTSLGADSLVRLVATITDKDGDSASASVNIGSNLVFEDDAPSISTNSTTEPTLTVDETVLATNASASFAGLFSGAYGADGAGTTTYGLAITAGPSGLVDIATLEAVNLVMNGGVVEGRTAVTNQLVFTASVDANGVVTLDQIRAVQHTPDLGPDQPTSLGADSLVRLVATITDKDGDSASASVNIGSNLVFEDDAPSIIDPAAATLLNQAAATTTVGLDVDSNVINNFGADGPGSVTFANIVNGQDTTQTSNGTMIELWLSPDGQTLQGRTGSTNGTDGTLIYTVQINQNAGTYTVTMTGEIDNGAGVSFSNLTSTAAGNVDVRGVGADDPATVVDLLLTASGPGGVNATINTDSDSVGSGNQSMDQGETVRIDFVTNLEDDPTDNLGLYPSGFSYDAHVGTQSLLQTIPQVQGNQNETVAFRVYALNTTVTDAGSPDDYPGNGFSDASIVAVTTVTIDGFDVGETPVTVAIGAVGVWTTIAYGVSAQLRGRWLRDLRRRPAGRPVWDFDRIGLQCVCSDVAGGRGWPGRRAVDGR